MIPSNQARWTFTLYPQAGEGGGCFQPALRRPAVGGEAPDVERSEQEASRRARAKLRRYIAANRLNRGGDRQLNWALHVVALQRIRHHPETSAYYEPLLAAGKTTREARRCVKRVLARHFFHRLREMPRLPLTT